MHLFSKLSGEILSLLRALGDTADQTNTRAYIIGEYPRSIFLNQDSSIIEITLTGNIDFFTNHFLKNYVQENSKNNKVIKQGRFNILVSPYCPEVLINIAQTRKIISGGAGDISSEIICRGFSIDALAVCINAKDFGDIADSAGAIQDIKAGVLRIINMDLFKEAPIMMIKALIFIEKYNLAVDPSTDWLWKDAISKNYHLNIPKKEISFEIEKIKKDKCGKNVIKLLKEVKIL